MRSPKRETSVFPEEDEEEEKDDDDGRERAPAVRGRDENPADRMVIYFRCKHAVSGPTRVSSRSRVPPPRGRTHAGSEHFAKKPRLVRNVFPARSRSFKNVGCLIIILLNKYLSRSYERNEPRVEIRQKYDSRRIGK